jgi:hypothetical protein
MTMAGVPAAVLPNRPYEEPWSSSHDTDPVSVDAGRVIRFCRPILLIGDIPTPQDTDRCR